MILGISVASALRVVNDAIPNSTDFWDTDQLVKLAAALAQRGLKQARHAIYEKFDLQQFDECWFGGYQIVELDGIEGLLYVAEVIGARLLKEPNFWTDDYLVTEAIERFGEKTVIAALEQQAKIKVNVRAYLKAIANHTKSIPTTNRSRPTMKQIEEKIEAGSGSFSGIYSSFGSRASQEDLEYIFSQLLTETRREQLIRYFWIFRKRMLPSLNKLLLSLAESDDKTIQEAAIVAIAHTQDSLVRDLGIRLLLKQPSSIYQRAIKLFIKNYQPGDDQLIESVLPVTDERHNLHTIGVDLIDLVEAQEDWQLASCCLWVYENTPCSLCRKSVVEAMLARQRLPETLRWECHWDANPNIRALTTSRQPSL